MFTWIQDQFLPPPMWHGEEKSPLSWFWVNLSTRRWERRGEDGQAVAMPEATWLGPWPRAWARATAAACPEQPLPSHLPPHIPWPWHQLLEWWQLWLGSRALTGAACTTTATRQGWGRSSNMLCALCWSQSKSWRVSDVGEGSRWGTRVADTQERASAKGAGMGGEGGGGRAGVVERQEEGGKLWERQGAGTWPSPLPALPPAPTLPSSLTLLPLPLLSYSSSGGDKFKMTTK